MRLLCTFVVVLGLLTPAPALAQDADAGDEEGACVPACRRGFVCHRGACVSRCNPPCAPGETCGQDGECRAPVATPARPAVPGADLEGVSPGWAVGAGRLGIVTALVLAASAVALVLAPDEIEVRLPIGIGAGVVAAIAVPVIASGGASARQRGPVTGHPTFRRTGWVAYVTALCDGVVLIALALGDADVPVAAGVGAVMLLSSSVLFFTLDAYESADQAQALLRQGPRPQLAVARDLDGRPTPVAGLSWSF
jgi:hypothetical protein